MSHQRKKRIFDDSLLPDDLGSDESKELPQDRQSKSSHSQEPALEDMGLDVVDAAVELEETNSIFNINSKKVSLKKTLEKDKIPNLKEVDKDPLPSLKDSKEGEDVLPPIDDYQEEKNSIELPLESKESQLPKNKEAEKDSLLSTKGNKRDKSILPSTEDYKEEKSSLAPPLENKESQPPESSGDLEENEFLMDFLQEEELEQNPPLESHENASKNSDSPQSSKPEDHKLKEERPLEEEHLLKEDHKIKTEKLKNYTEKKESTLFEPTQAISSVPLSPKSSKKSNHAFQENEEDNALARSEYLSLAQKRISQLEDEVQNLRMDIEKLVAAGETLKVRNVKLLSQNQNLEEKIKSSVSTSEEEQKLLRKAVSEKKRRIEDLKLEIGEMNVRLDANLQKVRVRERELESLLEISKREKEALLRDKDEIILELKRKLSQNISEINNFQNRTKELNEEVQDKNVVLLRVMKALRLSIAMIEGGTVPSSDENIKETGANVQAVAKKEDDTSLKKEAEKEVTLVKNNSQDEDALDVGLGDDNENYTNKKVSGEEN